MERCNRGHNLKGLEDPEVGSIVQADSPEKPLSSITFNGLGHSSGTSLYWTSMLKLMEEAAPVFSVTHSMDNIMPDANTGHSHPQPMEKSTPPPSSSSPSSSSVHDQPLDMMVYCNGIHSTDPDSSVWTEEFLNGSIGESKNCHVGNQPDTCSDDGLHELLYPRTVLELLLSDEPKCDQIPYSWSDIIQHTLSGNPNKPNFGLPVTLDKPTGDHNYDTANSQSTQVADIRLPQYFQNFSRFSCTDDRLSSSTASSTLSDCTTDQWAPAITSGSHYEHSQTQPSARHQNASFTNVQQVDRRRISAALFRSIENGNGIPSPHLQQNLHEQKATMNATSQMGFRNTDLTNDDYEEKPVLGNNICCDAQINANDRISHHHQQHIYESNTAATYSNNLKHSHRLSQIQCKPEPAFGTHNGITYTHGVANSIRGYNTQAQSQQHQRQYQPFQKIGKRLEDKIKVLADWSMDGTDISLS
ncbi:hypothetical protein KP509_33G029000 [Ceratopteris richardii]|uniref:Uncharacterized protein n=1 Tax=Ceratopteris richardii TaxID=49495 RepID=A0A8T2QN78_CERRI|nr:hypothetical protein KP509_33G029000 [Ceratopteris richardii]